jgi:hypothetical protein
MKNMLIILRSTFFTKQIQKLHTSNKKIEFFYIHVIVVNTIKSYKRCLLV